MIGLRDIDFLIIGAAKSATTWLQTALQADPRVRMPGPELHYFSRCYERGDAWYLGQFPVAEGSVVLGEKSNSYLDTPGAAGRIAEKLPHVHLIAQLRNPVERAYSDYCMLYRRGEVGRDLESWLDPRVSAAGRFIAGGLYYRQLERFVDRFPRDRLHVLVYEQAVGRSGDVLDDLCGNLGLGRWNGTAATGRVKDRAAPMAPPRLKRALACVRPWLEPYRSTRAFQKVRAIVAREMQYPPFPPELRVRLHDYYAPANEGLASAFGLDLSGWDPAAGRPET